jgi:hypothetical protein
VLVLPLGRLRLAARQPLGRDHEHHGSIRVPPAFLAELVDAWIAEYGEGRGRDELARDVREDWRA